VAIKLKVKEFEQWILQELNGYNCPAKDIPEYRKIVGNLVWYNPVHGWVPAVIQDDEASELIKRTKLAESAPQLLDLIKSEKGHGLAVQLNQNQQNLLSGLFKEQLIEMGLYGAAQFRLNLGKSQVQGILDTVRNIVLDWSLKLEEDGIMGEGLSFSEKEKQQASEKNYNITNFYASASGVQFQQNTVNSTQTMNNGVDIGQISDFISKLKENINGLPEQQQGAVESEIETISAELVLPQPQPSMLKQSLLSIKTMLEGAAGNIIASGLLYELAKIHF
jgi:hypothetical protein